MTALTDNQIKNTYMGLLQVPGGVSNTFKRLEDGLGAALPVRVKTDIVEFDARPEVTSAGQVALKSETDALATAVAAAGASLASNIASVNYGGAREFGGPVDAGKMYRVGEGGAPEIFQSGGKNFMIPGEGGKVIPNDQIGGGGFSQNVQVHNYSGENVQTKTSMDGKQMEIIVGEISKQISQRRGGVGRALASSTGTKWKAQ